MLRPSGVLTGSPIFSVTCSMSFTTFILPLASPASLGNSGMYRYIRESENLAGCANWLEHPRQRRRRRLDFDFNWPKGDKTHSSTRHMTRVGDTEQNLRGARDIMSTFKGLYVDGLRRRGRRSRVLLWQRTRHPPHGRELTVVNTFVRVCQWSAATKTVVWRVHLEEGRGRSASFAASLVGSPCRLVGPCLVDSLARDRLGVPLLAIDRSIIPVVDDGITGADLLGAADHLLGDRELDMDNLRAHRGHPQERLVNSSSSFPVRPMANVPNLVYLPPLQQASEKSKHPVRLSVHHRGRGPR